MLRRTPPPPPMTDPGAMDSAPAPLGDDAPSGVPLFWRTLFLLLVLLSAASISWLCTVRSYERTQAPARYAQHLGSMLQWVRPALELGDATLRRTLLNGLAEHEEVFLRPVQVGDVARGAPDPEAPAELTRAVQMSGWQVLQLTSLLGSDSAFWAKLRSGADEYWLRVDRKHYAAANSTTWIWGVGLSSLLSIVGAIGIALLINTPIRELSFAASRVRDGDYSASELNEQAATSEIREVNRGFNRMARQLAKVEQDRVVMLAGISHDLRTPLARLRLETEMSVADASARDHMAADIDQLDAIIDKFLDYARPDQVQLTQVDLDAVVEAALFAVQDSPDLRLTANIERGLRAMGDEVELARVFSNLIENARRYGKSPDTGFAKIEISGRARGDWVLIKVRDYGMGVSAEALPNLIKPFFRGDAARTAATGAGLGLAIVDKTVQRMGGVFALTNSSRGGLAAHIKLQGVRVDAPSTPTASGPGGLG